MKETGEEGVKQIKALLGLGDIVTNVNILNKGQITNVPVGAVVETNALIRRNSIAPVEAGSLTYDINGLVIRNIMNVEAVVEGGITRNLNLAYNAFINDPLVNIGLRESKALFQEMLDNTKDYLKIYGL